MKYRKSNHNLTISKRITSGIIRSTFVLGVLVCVGCSQNKDIYSQSKGSEPKGKVSEVEVPGADLRACCRVYTRSQCSSGFIVLKDSEKIVIAASLHGLSDWGEGSEIIFYDGSSAFGQVFGSDDELDAGFIEIAVSDIDEETLSVLEPISGVEEASQDDLVNITQTIYAFDLFPEGSFKADPKAIRYEGELISKDQYLYDFDRNMLFGKLECVNDGMSGTPVFSDDGKCLGMIVAGNDDGQFAGVFYEEMMKLLYFP